MATLVLLRHGQTEWSRDGRHTSRTDLPLTPVGEDQARALAPAVRSFAFGLVLASPRQRAVATARLAGLDPQLDDDLVEWDYGRYEGVTTDEIVERDGPWNMWQDGAPGGEDAAAVGARVDRALARVRPVLDEGHDACVVAHGHVLRVLAARYLALPPSEGAHLRLDTGTVCTLGTEHGRPVLTGWNVPACAWG
ncbi:putative phosphoglycerate mutase [Motilibacter rhizosphaerae]|uniref:Putative phosphoglycerate mutase n=1 Tax=Motilibacter rhizosphaerae TaxID=598652 RepID=A0A4Q7NQA9_9ACTN|nr:histidine phosphatase family protein [Motilibacter rhizosphaerae]RZS87479.1 putative phosphoglycerate mutase [Motilibacter rhizosphaerae]